VAGERLRRQIREQAGDENRRADQEPVDDAQAAQAGIALR
jgi:hypothetical protein